MRACAVTNLGVLGVLIAVATFAACSGGSSPNPASSQSPQASPGSPASDTEPAPSSAPGEANGTAGNAKTARDCANLVTEITNDPPDDAVAMNNAQTAGDAGSSDRLAPIVEVMKQNRDAFRCCFDLWGRENPGQSSKLAFRIEIRPSGEVRKAGIEHDESELHAKNVDECMVEVVQSLAFPESPTGKDTLYTHRFNFTARP